MRKGLMRNKLVILIIICLTFMTVSNSGVFDANNMTQFAGTGISTSEFTTKDAGDPDPPTLVSPTSGSVTNDNTPTLDWNPEVNVLIYELQVDNDPGFGSPAFDVSTGQTDEYTCTFLPDTTYYWHVRVLDETLAYSDWSSTWNFQIDTVAPGIPTLVSPTTGTRTDDNTTYFSWSSVSTATLYQIQIDDSSTFSSPAISTSTSNIYYTSTALPDDTYYWRVRARDAAGNWGTYSSFWVLEIDTTGPDGPTLISPLSGTSSTDRTPTLVWGAVPGATSYWVQIASNSGFTSLLENTSAGATPSHTCSITLGDGIYYWRAMANDGLNWGTYSSTWIFVVDNVAPGAPTLLSPIHPAYVNNQTPLLEWSLVSGAALYQVQIDTSNQFSSPIFDTLTAATSCFSSILAEDTYYWHVRAIDAASNIGGWSDDTHFLVDVTNPDPPILLTPDDGLIITDSLPYCEWSSNEIILVSHIEIDDDPTFLSPIIEETSFSAFFPVFSSATLPDGTYFWRVRTQDIAFNPSGWSLTWNFTIDTTAPVINSIENIPISPDDNDEVLIRINVTDATDLSVNLLYKVNDGEWTGILMPSVASGIYETNLGVFSYDDFIEYRFLIIENILINPHIVVDDNGGSNYSFTVASSDITEPTINSVVFDPVSPYDNETITISCSVTDASDILSVVLYYRINDGSWLPIGMIYSTGSTYTAIIGPFSAGDTIDFYIVAIDYSPNQNSATDDNTGDYYSFTVIAPTDDSPLFIFFPLLAVFTTLLFVRKKK